MYNWWLFKYESCPKNAKKCNVLPPKKIFHTDLSTKNHYNTFPYVLIQAHIKRTDVNINKGVETLDNSS